MITQIHVRCTLWCFTSFVHIGIYQIKCSSPNTVAFFYKHSTEIDKPFDTVKGMISILPKPLSSWLMILSVCSPSTILFVFNWKCVGAMSSAKGVSESSKNKITLQLLSIIQNFAFNMLNGFFPRKECIFYRINKCDQYNNGRSRDDNLITISCGTCSLSDSHK